MVKQRGIMKDCKASSAAIYVYSAFEDRERLDIQERACRELCENSLLRIAGLYREAGKHREGLGRLLKDAEKGAFDIVILDTLDRLGRHDLMFYFEALQSAGVTVITNESGGRAVDASQFAVSSACMRPPRNRKPARPRRGV